MTALAVQSVKAPRGAGTPRGTKPDGRPSMKNVAQSCSVDDCERHTYCRGLCQAHYRRWRLRGKVCSVDGCNASAYCRGWCQKHYNRWRLHGDINPTTVFRPDPGERWRPVRGFEGEYEVSDHGRVRSLDREFERCNGAPQRRKGKVLAAMPNGRGYPEVTLSYRRGGRSARVHLLVAEAFLGPRPDGLYMNHKDGDKTNNHVSNLEWVTFAENMSHAYAIGLNHAVRLAGSDNPLAKLTWDDVKEIRQLGGSLRQREIAERYGVTQSNIGCVLRGETWRDQ